MFASFSISHAEANVKHEARRSLSIILLISFLPLVLGFLAVVVKGQVGEAIVTVFLSGQLYFYAMSLCGSLYVTSQISNHEGNLGMRIWSGVFVIVSAVFMAFYVGQSNLANAPDPIYHGVASIGFLVLAVLLNYRVMVLANQPPPMPEHVNRERAEIMTKAVDPQYD